MKAGHLSAMLQAVMAALLFGASAPLAKMLLGEIEPIPLAACLYLGSGLGLAGWKLVQRARRQFGTKSEARLSRADLGWLAGAVLAGGVAAPIVLLFSLRYTPAATASLLLNFECVATTLLAALVFKECVSRSAGVAIALITLASLLLSITSGTGWGVSVGALGIIAACALWGLDNNLTRQISAKDPLMMVTVKGLGAGGFSLVLAVVLGQPLPALGVVAGALVLGCLSYGASIVLFIHAMRRLGAARASALYGTAPVAGMVLSFLLFREFPTGLFLLALPLMVVGALLLMNEDHTHPHVHEPAVHDHAHAHDDGHHLHTHEAGSVLAHAHLHNHAELAHAHHHLPDVGHRHAHSADA